MRKVLSVIFIMFLLVISSSCGKASHEITDIAKEEFEKYGIENPEIASCAMGGSGKKAIGLYLAEYGENDKMCLAIEYDMQGKNSYVYSETFLPEEIYDKIYTLEWNGGTVLFVANEECASVVVDGGKDGNRVDHIRNSSYPYLTIEEGVKEFICYDENMKEIGR